MAINKELNMKFINGKRYRFEPTVGELADLARVPYVDLLSAVLADTLAPEVLTGVVAQDKARHEAKEDARIADVKQRHADIRSKGVCMEHNRTVWHTTNRG